MLRSGEPPYLTTNELDEEDEEDEEDDDDEMSE
jgi:hypothetical protein